MRIIEIKCKKCGADLEIDFDDLIAYCPYCGSKLRIDIDRLDRIISAKEKTKRAKMFYDNESERDQNDFELRERKSNFIQFVALATLLIILGLVYSILEKHNLI